MFSLFIHLVLASLKFVNVNISKSIIQGSRFCQPELMSAHTSPWAKKRAPAGTITGQGAQGKGDSTLTEATTSDLVLYPSRAMLHNLLIRFYNSA
ncbi:hypothetical protein D3C73_1025620 [compost metagenome]